MPVLVGLFCSLIGLFCHVSTLWYASVFGSLLIVEKHIGKRKNTLVRDLLNVLGDGIGEDYPLIRNRININLLSSFQKL